MADKFRSQNAHDPYGSHAYGRPRDRGADGPHARGTHASGERDDPLAELARLIGQDDPFAAQRPAQPRYIEPRAVRDDDAPDWLTRSTRSGGGDAYDERYDPAGRARPGSADDDRWQSPPHQYDARDEEQLRQDHAYGRAEGGYDTADDTPQDGDTHYDTRYEPHFASRPAHQSAAAASPHYDAHAYGDAGSHRDASAYADDPYASAASVGAGAYDPQRHESGDGAQYAYEPPRNADYDPDAADPQFEHASEDSPPLQRRRTGAVALVAVTTLIVIGVAGAFGYRAYTGGSGGGNAPVIMADAGPNKVVPQGQRNDGPASGKLIYDRVADRGQGERVVSREEQPVDVKTTPRIVLPGGPAVQVPQPPPWNVAPPASIGTNATTSPGTTSSAPVGTASGNEPKRVRTMTIRPEAAPGAEPARPAPVRSAAIGATPMPSQPVTATPPTAVPTRTVRSSPGQAPLSIAPPSEAIAAPTRTAAIPPPQTRASSDGGIMVQLTSQKTESDAQASYRALQTRYPAVLGSREPVIRRADLGSKGVYYRAQVGPFSSLEQANEFCGSLKAAGGQCIVQRN